MKKTIVIDGFNLNLEKGTGVATYARNLSYEIHNLGMNVGVLYGNRAIQSRDKLLREIAFYDSNVERPSFFGNAIRSAGHAITTVFGSRATPVPMSGAVISQQFASRMPYYDTLWNAPDLFARGDVHFYLYQALLAVHGMERPDIMHWTYPLPLHVRGTKNIYTLHDLVPLRLPYTSLDLKKNYLRLMQRLVKKADHIVTVSETSRRDIINLVGCPEEKITNTYQAVDIPEKYANKSENLVRQEVEGTFGLEYKSYFLFFGSLEPKKNIGRIIEAYLASKVEAPLVVLGARAWKSENELRLINETTNRYLEKIDNMTFMRDRIRRFDYAPFPLLVSLIRGAKAVVFPSLYEGFGLPILEAMSLGTPVITSTEGSVPEVAGDAALKVNPYDTRAIADAIIEMDHNADLRGRLSVDGRKQAAKYSAENYRQRLGTLYNSL